MADSKFTPVSQKPKQDFSVASRFLAWLDPEPNAVFSIQTAPHNCIPEHEWAGLIRQFHGTLAQMANVYFPQLARLNDLGAVISITPNATNGQGRKITDIVRVRAQFIDLDGASLERVLTWHTPPHAVIESSPGHYHCYWLVEGMPLADFPACQEALIDEFGADRNGPQPCDANAGLPPPQGGTVLVGHS
jgi:hypothetical protein